ncbi:MAG: efflux RND transporter periplasmic adaptor subunit [Candidatus Syntrophosphaera sp.]|nr:efflux RND transporter periplasmic adaptor subunit [Candidatus Syntrophosphaera sp.]
MKKLMLIGLITAALLIGACGKKNETGKNIEQIQREQGIPVRVRILELERFTRELDYNAALGGREESTASAMVSDFVTSVKVRVGDRVSAGQLVLTFPRNTPAAQYEQASAAFEATRKAYERMSNLFAQGAISRQDLDNVETQYKVAQANLEASSQMINVTSPISGVVTNIMVNTGDKTYPGQPLFTVSSTNGFKARLMIPAQDIQLLKPGTPATAIWGDQTLKGSVSRIALALDPYAKAVPVEVTFPGANPRISFGSTAQIKLLTLARENVILVNREHMISENDTKYVWVNENNHAVKRGIETGLDNQLQYEVVSGLEPGEALIVEGLSLLDDSALIRVID